MAHWLVKSEPSSYSWEQLEKDKETCWSGIRNYAARLHLRAMKKGDEVFFYHSNEGTDIVGIAKVVKEAYQDPTTDDDRWVAVDLKLQKKLKKPVNAGNHQKRQAFSKYGTGKDRPLVCSTGYRRRMENNSLFGLMI